MGYTMDPDTETTAKAYGKNLQISPKTSVEVCRFVRGKDVDVAIDMLDEVVEGKRPVPYRKHKKQIAHQKGVGPGGYPKKAATKIRDLLNEAKSNAESKGLDSDDMEILAISAHQGEVIQGYQPRAFGRTTPSDRKTTNIEVILKERGA
ncbi:MAG: 50S ribosomal protein L22 [Candidatus Saliniplasma sp.]